MVNYQNLFNKEINYDILIKKVISLKNIDSYTTTNTRFFKKVKKLSDYFTYI